MLPLSKKKGDKILPVNYRPIILTTVVGKLKENIIRNKLVSSLEENIMINNTQHGYRNKISCLTNLFDFHDDVFNIYDETKAVDVIHLDFQNTFGKVLKNRLLKVTWHSWKNSQVD